MFEQLFDDPKTVARYRGGPLAEERSRYLVHLAEQGLARKTLRPACRYLLAAANGLRLAKRPNVVIGYAEIERQGARWAKRLRKGFRQKGSDNERKCFVRWTVAWLRFLGRLRPQPVAPRRFEKQIVAFADYCRQERGLAASTIRSDSHRLQKFFECLAGRVRKLQEITIAQIDEALIEHVSNGDYARNTISTLAYSLRAFFHYGERRGWCRAGIAAGIKAPCVFAEESLPAGPSWEQVQQVLATTEGSRRADIRDRAILMLLAIYGLRSVEVKRLKLEDLDWEHELLTVTRSKTRRTQSFPLVRSVGNAILRYLKEVRPRSPLREVFLTRCAPWRPLRANLWRMVAPRLRALGVSLPHYGPHALRHACATHLLAQGLSLKEIGDHLGHQHPDSTHIYTKVDLTGLRQVADFDLGGLI
jgi:integrase/recombinase XerD